MPEDIEVRRERDGDVLVLVPVGRLDSTNAREFEDIVLDHIRAGERSIVVDFVDLTFISSSGMRVLLIAAKKLRAAAGKIVLCTMSADIREIFVISGFIRIITILDDRASAIDIARP